MFKLKIFNKYLVACEANQLVNFLIRNRIIIIANLINDFDVNSSTRN